MITVKNHRMQEALSKVESAVREVEALVTEQLPHLEGDARLRGEILHQSAIGRMREAGMLLALSVSKPFEVEFHHALDGLKDMLTRTHDLVGEEIANLGPVGDDLDINEVEQILEAHELALQAATQAEISSSCAMLHLHTALTLADGQQV